MAGATILEMGEDPYEHDFRAATYRADDLAVKTSRLLGPTNTAATFFDDGPVLREEILCSIRAADNFRAYQLVYEIFFTTICSYAVKLRLH